MSHLSNLAPDSRVDRSRLDDALRGMDDESAFFVGCNRALKSAKAFHARTMLVRSDLNRLRQEFTRGELDGGLGTEAELEGMIGRCMAAEESIAADWDTQRKHLATLAERLRDHGGMKRMMLTRVSNATNRAFSEAVALPRDCRILCIAALAEHDELEPDVIETPEQLRSYFDRVAGTT